MGIFSPVTKTTSSENATTNPLLPGYVAGAMPGYFDAAQQWFNSTAPNSLIPGQNSLQTMGFDNATNLGQNSGGFNYASLMTKDTLGKLTGGASPTGGQGLQVTSAAPAPTSSPATYNAAQARLPDPLNPVAVAGFGSRDVAGYDPASIDATAGPQGGRALPFINDYLDPYLEQNVAATLAAADDYSSREKAAYAAKGAKAGAFGGSRFGIGEAQLRADQGLRRGQLEGGLRKDAWQYAGSLAAGDAANATSAGISSAQIAAERALAQAEMEQQSSRDYATASNEASGQVYDAGVRKALADALAANDIGRLMYSTEADTSRFNAGETNDMLSENASNWLKQQGLVLDAAGQMADISGAAEANQRANIGTQLDAGQSMFDMQTLQNMAPATRLQIYRDLLDAGLIDAVSGQEVTSSGRGTSKTSGGIGNLLLGGAFQLGAAAIGKK